MVFSSFVVCSILWTLSQSYITYIEPRFPLPGEKSPPGTPWPYPKSWERSKYLLTIDPKKFYINSTASDCDIIEEAIKRYKKIILDMKAKKNPVYPVLKGLHVNVGSEYDCGFPKHEDDESYDIVVPENGPAEIQTKTVWGALRGLETFSQLIFDSVNASYLINATKIHDEPRFKYRGVHVDTSRHYMSIKILKKNLDAMSYNKFNAFHWHIIDDQSFPFESKVFPNLTTLGAYMPKLIYTQKNIRDIIQYARNRGIRVIPEFDTPGHTKALGRAFPHLLTPCYGEGPDRPCTPNYPKHASAEILNPMIDQTYDVIKALVREVKTVFVDEYIHLGMDEVYYDCWNSSPAIADFMKKHHYENLREVEQHYVEKTLKNVKDVGYKYMIWQDPIDSGVQVEPDTIVEVWKEKYLGYGTESWSNYMAPIVSKGYQIILAACWYLSYKLFGDDWKQFYECDPLNFEATKSQKELVIGGEACMWAEYIDSTNLLSRMWPRASAVAERLWSPSHIRDTDSAAFRLDEQRCRMLRRGIPAGPILNGYCGDYEWDITE